MPPRLVRTCSECPKPLHGKGPHAKTCSDGCRAKRSRRLRRRAKDAAAAKAYPEHVKEFSQAVSRVAPDIAQDVIREELRPIAREALTEDVLRSIKNLVSLTPRAIECMAEDLQSEDPAIRQRAYTLVTKYTIGHQALVRPDDAAHGGQLIVNFELPRPGTEPQHSDSVAVELESDELRTCDMCEESKPITDFVAGSQRCVTCYEGQRELARGLMKDAG